MIPNFNYAPGSDTLGDRACKLIQQGHLLELTDYGKCKQTGEAFPTWKVFVKIANDTPAGHQFRFYGETTACKFVEYIQSLQPTDNRIMTTVYL